MHTIGCKGYSEDLLAWLESEGRTGSIDSKAVHS